MGKKSKKGDRSPSVERLRKKLKKIQEKLVMKDKDTSRSSSRDHDTFSLSSKETDTPRDIDLNPLLDEEDKENQNVNNLNLEVTELEKNDDDFVELDEETLEILGEGLVRNEEEFAFHPKLAEAWKKVLAEGIDKKSKSSFSKRTHGKATVLSTH
ncbi:uncharacterized protein LOC143903366 [Temnothorax americanus]|uniref:uncharacterized protein LOC143903366 n=1 Tax=Temnothorax americanus TaxID=1964332 RepID=UPI0040685462